MEFGQVALTAETVPSWFGGTSMLRFADPALPELSFTCKVNENVIAALAVPVIVTLEVVLLPKASPVGSVPVSSDQEYGAVPPDAFTVAV